MERRTRIERRLSRISLSSVFGTMLAAQRIGVQQQR